MSERCVVCQAVLDPRDNCPDKECEANIVRNLEERIAELERELEIAKDSIREVCDAEIRQLQAEVERLKKFTKDSGKGAERNAWISNELAKKNNELQSQLAKAEKERDEWRDKVSALVARGIKLEIGDEAFGKHYD